MIKCGWRLGIVDRQPGPKRDVTINAETWVEYWNGIDAATGLTLEQFEDQIDRIERNLDQLVVKRAQTIELHIRFSCDISDKK